MRIRQAKKIQKQASGWSVDDFICLQKSFRLSKAMRRIQKTSAWRHLQRGYFAYWKDKRPDLAQKLWPQLWRQYKKFASDHAMAN